MGYSSAVAITATKISSAGSETTTLATTPTATDGNKVLQDNRTWLQVYNGSGAPITVTLKTNVTIDGIALGDKTITVNAGVRKVIDIKHPAYTQSDGYVWFICSAVTDVKVQAFSNN